MTDTKPNGLIRWRWVIAAVFGLFAIAFVAYGDWIRAAIAVAVAAAFVLYVGSAHHRRRVERGRHRYDERRQRPPKR